MAKPVTVTFDPTALLDYYTVKEGLTSSSSSTTSTPAIPTAPWNSAASTSTTSTSTSSSQAAAAALSKATTLAGSLLNSGAKLINPAAAKLSVSTNNAAANSDYQNLFALYQGLSSLQSLAAAASASGIASSTLTQLQSAFANGLDQVQSFMTSSPFKEFEVGDGTVTARDVTSSGVPLETDAYTTGLVASSASTPLAQLQGNVQFSMTVQTFHNTPQTVQFDLADMGSTPRTLGNVVSYLNGQLAAAGVKTRFSDQLISAGTTASSTASASGSTTSLGSTGAPTSTTLPQIALTIQGSALETISFSAPSATPAVYVAQTSTEPVLASTSTSTSTSTSSTSSTSTSTLPTATTASQVLALDPTGRNAVSVGDKLWTDNLPSDATVQTTATAPDGSVYVLADVTGAADGQGIQGTQDVALMKYDSAGDLVYTRTLGAATSASGYALAVAPDGSQVAVAGTVTGTLDPTDTADAGSTTLQSFVTTYSAAGGDELWTQTQDADVDNQATGVAFGSDNKVYVTGSVQGTLQPGAISNVTEQGYLQTYSATAATDPTTGEVTWTGAPTSTTQFGTSGVNRATGVAVSGSTVYISGVENGDGVVRAYDTSSETPTLTARQDLGPLNGGSLNGIAVDASGAVYVAGSTHDGALNAGTITSAYSGNGDAFVAKLSPTLDPTAGESLAYLNNGDATTATALAVAAGQVYVTGQTATGASASGASISELGYAAEINPTTGQVAWNQAFKGSEGNAASTSIAVEATGASSLDALGLPTGTIAYTTSNTLVANTSLRAGDQFSVQVGSGAPTTVTIAADDTYSTLATKIEQASGYRVTATTTTGSNDTQQLVITPASSTTQAQVEIEPGPTGRDALAALGLKAGLITNASSNSPSTVATAKNASSALKAAYTVNVPTTLSLSSPSAIAAAQTQLSTAMAEIKSIYTNMTVPNATSTNTSSSNNSALVTFYNNQAAGYATALARLTGTSASA